MTEAMFMSDVLIMPIGGEHNIKKFGKPEVNFYEVEENILPRPVIRDGNGRLTRNYSSHDWLMKLAEEIFEVAQVANAPEEYDEISLANEYKVSRLENELADVITVCISWLEQLGCNEKAYADLFRAVNEKNEKRGYFREK